MKNLTLDSLSEVSGGYGISDILSNIDISGTKTTLWGYDLNYTHNDGIYRFQLGKVALEYDAR